MLTLINFLRTESLIRPFLKPTPLVFSEYYSEKLKCNVWFKLETLQPTGTFKVRGAFSKILRIPESQRAKGVVSASGGNHGMAVAYAAQKVGVPAHIFMPKKAPKLRIETAKSLGATVSLEGNVLDEANSIASKFAQEQGLTFIHPFLDPEVQLGQGTMGVEIYQQLPHLDVVVASMGGGGLIAGLATIFKAMDKMVHVYGVETEGADCITQSVQSGHLVTLPKITSIAESLGALTTSEANFSVIKDNVDAVATVTDEEAVQSLLTLLIHQKLLTEPAASCSLAALELNRLGPIEGKDVVVVLCGASVEPHLLHKWLTGYGQSI